MSQSIKLFSVLSDQFQNNPYAYFSQLREEDPVHYEESIDSYFISRYHDVRYILQHPDIFTTKSLVERVGTPFRSSGCLLYSPFSSLPFLLWREKQKSRLFLSGCLRTACLPQHRFSLSCMAEHLLF